MKGTIHWVSAAHAIDAEVRLYDRLFNRDNPYQTEDGGHFTQNLNPDSLEILTGCKLEPSLRNAKPGDKFQFLRKGYFCADSGSTAENPVFNRIVTLKDTWAKISRN